MIICFFILISLFIISFFLAFFSLGALLSELNTPEAIVCVLVIILSIIICCATVYSGKEICKMQDAIEYYKTIVPVENYYEFNHDKSTEKP